MKTIDQKVDGIIGKFPLGVIHYSQVLREVLRVALKEQDRDTRHACAEAVMTLPEKYTIDGDDGYVDVNQAHNTIMNCRGGTI